MGKSEVANSEAEKRPLPLAGIRVIDLGQVYAVPHVGAMLADLGAEVIKVEGPERLDVTRLNGVYADAKPGQDPWNRSSIFSALNRGKKSLVLDLQKQEGRNILLVLAGKSDILMENFTSRVMKKWGLDYGTLSRSLPSLIMVSNTGYGQGAGPYSEYPAQATTQEATHGLAHLTGYRAGPPSKAGASYIDFLAASACMSGITLALRQRRRTGRGQWIEVGMYQIGCFAVGEYILDWQSNSRIAERIGNRHPWLAPQGCYPCAGDDQWCVLCVRNDGDWLALCELVGDAALQSDPRFLSNEGRMRHHEEIDTRIRKWTSERARQDVVHELQRVGLPASAVLHAGELHFDPHLRQRAFMETVAHPPERAMGDRTLMGTPWKFSETPLSIPGPAPDFGAHNRELLMRVLGYDGARCDDLERRGIIALQPASHSLAAYADKTIEEMVALGLFASCDGSYRDLKSESDRGSS